MSIFNSIRLVFISACVVFPLYATADDSGSVECGVDEYKGKYFASVYEKASSASMKLCEAYVIPNIIGKEKAAREVEVALGELAKSANDSLKTTKIKELGNFESQMKSLDTTFLQFDYANPTLPEFKDPRDPTIFKAYFSPLEIPAGKIQYSDPGICVDGNIQVGCDVLLSDFKGAFNAYRTGYNKAYNNRAKLSSIGKRWDEFLEASKSQTFLEVWLTTVLHGTHFKKDHIVGPPGSQVIALHPHLIYDSFSKAPDGSNMEFGMALEVIGINFWDWDVPFGVSYTQTFVDRVGVSDVGHGVMVHINNHYSFGVSQHGQDNSYYVTIDLLKAFEDKKDKYEQYLR